MTLSIDPYADQWKLRTCEDKESTTVHAKGSKTAAKHASEI